MYWLIGLLFLETGLEGLLCRGVLAAKPWWQRLSSLGLGTGLLALSVALTFSDWRIWAWGLPVVMYRLLNLGRLYYNRLPPQQLRTVCARAYWWLVMAQTVLTVVAWITVTNHFGMTLFDILLATQLLAAITLMRASTHTWQYSRWVAATESLTDRQLPTVSVLVPARNETDDLELCLNALTASDYPKMEILVLDDCSVNRHTPEIIRSYAHAGVRFVQGQLPDESRWLAKNFAYEQLSGEASGELLLFCAVDAILGPHSLRQMVEKLEAEHKDMLSLMPLRSADVRRGSSMLQAMRYYWEICLPRGFFKRPPVLSTCWLIRSRVLEQMGGFESVTRSVSPEASFARKAVVNNTYLFMRSDAELAVFSNKPVSEQYDTSVRVRYPQLHRRLELVALAGICEAALLLGPLAGLLLASQLAHTMAYVLVWLVSLVCSFITYAIVSVGTRLANPWVGWLLMPLAFLVDLGILHVSLWKYEFGSVNWKGRNVCIPVMRLEKQAGKTTLG